MANQSSPRPKHVMPLLLLPLHVVPVAALAAAGWWYGHASSSWKSDLLPALALLIGLPSATALWRIVVLSLAAKIVESPRFRPSNLSVQSWLLTQAGGRALEVALWIGVPAAFGLHIIRHAPAVSVGFFAGAPIKITHALLVLLLCVLIQQTRVCADALRYCGATAPLERPIPFVTWVVWGFVPLPIWCFGMLTSFGEMRLDPVTFLLIDLPILTLLAYAIVRLILCLRGIPSVSYERSRPS